MIAGPEQARLLKEFEQEYISDGNKLHHIEGGMSTPKRFKEQALVLVHTISGMSNPFVDDSLMLGTRIIIDEFVVNTVRTGESVGIDQYKYHDTVIKDRTYSIHEPIKRNSLSLFRRPRQVPNRQGRSPC